MRRALPALAMLSAMACAFAAEPSRPQPLRSGIEFHGADARALQADDFGNPGMLWVARGEALWSEAPANGKSCAACHGDAPKAMAGVAARYPRHDPALGRVVNLEERINACVAGKQGGKPHAWESEALLGLTTYVARQSKGAPIQVSIEGAARATYERGRHLYFERQGQLNLACHQCHDRNWGRTLLAEKVSQGHPADWPAYRLEWQKLGSLQRRLRACYFGVRAELPGFGSDDLRALELYLAWRAQGLAVSPPGVRK